MINVEDVTVSYDGEEAVKNVSMSIPEKKVTAFIGPSGCGKTSLLRCFNRMTDEIPECSVEGVIRLGEANILDPKLDPVALRRRVGMVFQKPNPFPKSIFDNIAYGPRLHGENDKSRLKEIVEESLRDAALWGEVKDRLNSDALSLSGGQQQRLCIARALAVKPHVLLMDEPCSALDPIATSKIEDLIQKLKKDYTVIIVTHNMQQAARISDETGFMYLGELIEYGKTIQIFENPRQELTEKYITGRFG